ncbi:hypothetical protein [Chamaesiphon polymorphus]|uniref:Uncharacterized protein n=1 Tax=Chamaesiphon polymorphus CCALA 037 TaxID=2107692 RepID=A0A2T1GC05_9CYAN|nr:hypothetical protein [Chamaesiphon polymorphus]PSB54832.1 hypothetical protein C7B77_16940 [Chamaesiphon polymorphus CCALA 037]
MQPKSDKDRDRSARVTSASTKKVSGGETFALATRHLKNRSRHDRVLKKIDIIQSSAYSTDYLR